MKTKIILYFTTLIISLLTVEAQPGRPSIHSGEKLNYKAYFHWGFLWIHAGDVGFKTVVDKTSYKKTYRFTSSGKSLKKFDWLYKVRDRYEVTVDPVDLKPIYFFRDTNEGGKRLIFTYLFDREKALIYIQSLRTGKIQREFDTLNLVKDIRDVLSAIYYTRTLPYSTFKNGDQIPLNLIVNGILYELKIIYYGKETIKLHNQKEYSCFKISIQLPPGTLFRGGEDLTVWLSNDPARIPILVNSKVLVGSVTAELAEMK